MAEHDGKVTFDLEIDDSKVRGALSRALSAIRSQAGAAKISVSADTGAAISSLARVKAAENDLTAKPIINVEAHTAAADTKLQKTLGNAYAVDGSDPNVDVTANTTAADGQLDTTKGKADEVGAEKPNVAVTANTETADGQLDTTKGKAADLEAADPSVNVNANTAAADVKLQRTLGNAYAVEGADPNVDVTAGTDAADELLENTLGLANKLDGTDPTVQVQANTGAADIKLQRTTGLAYGLEGTDPNVDATANTDAADTLLERTLDLASQVETSDPNVNATATTGGANPLLEHTRDLASQVETSDPNVNVTATDAASSVLADVRDLANDLNGTNVNVNVTSNGGGFGSNLIQGVGQGIGHTLPGAVFGAAGNTIGSVFSSGLTYESGLAKVSTLMPENADKEAFGAAALALAGELGVDIGTMMEAAYNSLSASVDYGKTPGGENLLKFLETSTKLGIGGFTDTNTAADALTSVYNAYNGQISTDAIANLMLRTQNKGKITVGQIAQSVAQITPAASTSGVGFDQVGAMWAALTAGGVQPAQAATQIRTLLNELNQSGSKGNEAMLAALSGTKWSGMSLQQIMAGGGSMVEVLDAIQKYSAKKGKALSNFFGSSEAAGAVAFLTGENLDRFQESLGYMREEGDLVNEAYSTMAETTEQSLERIRAQFAAYAAEIFTALAPAVEKFLEIIQGEKFKETFGRLVDKITELLSGDAIEGLVDGLISAANWLLDVFSGKISLGDFLEGALESAWTWLMGKASEFGEWIRSSIATALEGLDLPDWAKKLLGIGQGGNINNVPSWLAQDIQNGSAETPRNKQESTAFDGSSGITHGGISSTGEPGTDMSARGRFGGNRSGGGAETSTNHGVDRKSSTGITLVEIAIETDKMEESSKAAAESTAETAETTAQTAENQAAIAEASGETAVSLEETAENEAAVAHASRISSGRAASMARNLASAHASLYAAAVKAASLEPAISDLVDSIGRAKRAAGASVTDPHTTKYAVGLDYVPHDNFPALLHRGEMVLNAAEASALRFSGDRGSSGIDPGALASAMAGLAVEMDGRVVGRLVERSVSAQQAVRLNRTQYGRGG